MLVAKGARRARSYRVGHRRLISKVNAGPFKCIMLVGWQRLPQPRYQRVNR